MRPLRGRAQHRPDGTAGGLLLAGQASKALRKRIGDPEFQSSSPFEIDIVHWSIAALEIQATSE
jgi:hypothetical protein